MSPSRFVASLALSFAALAALPQTLFAQAADAPTMEIKFDTQRWQTLPADVRMVYLGPDQRPWFVTKLAEGPADITKVKADIEAQWSKPTPVIHQARIALFEKSGKRVWFITGDSRTLLGYDGKTWAELPTHAGNREIGFLGDDPAHGRTANTPCNLDLGAYQVFVESSGFTAFDGKNWIYQEISQNANGPLDLFPELGAAAGKNAIAVRHSFAQAWRFADGKWSAINLGIGDRASFRAVMPSPDGALMVQVGTFGLSRLPLDGAGAPGITARVPMMFNDIDMNAQVPGPVGDLSGNLCVSVGNLTASPLTSGRNALLVLRADGARFQVPTAARSQEVPLFRDDGKTLFLPGTNGIQRIDLSATPPTMTTLPDPSYTFIQALAADGTMYLTPGAPMTSGNLAGSGKPGAPPEITRAAIYRPQIADDRPTLVVKGVEADMTNPVLAADGAIWSSLRTGVGRFDGKEWKTIHDHYALYTELYPGASGDVLMWQGHTFSLLRPDGRVDGTMLDDFIKDHPAEFSKAFGTDVDASLFRSNAYHSSILPAQASGIPNEGGWSIATDNQAHIWFTISRTLRVLDKGAWVSVPWPVISPSPNTKTPIPGPSMVFPLEGGKSMFIYASRSLERVNGPDTKPAPKFNDYVATFKDGKAELTPVENQYVMNIFEDELHTLWLTSGDRGPWTVRHITAAGVQDSFTVSQPPKLLDKSNIVWLSPAKESYELLVDHKVAGHVSVPGADESSKLVSDKPLSVWAWTTTGLHHLVADPGKPFDYKLAASFIIKTEEGNVVAGNGTFFGISPLGFFYASARAEGPGSKRFTYTAALPAK